MSFQPTADVSLAKQWAGVNLNHHFGTKSTRSTETGVGRGGVHKQHGPCHRNDFTWDKTGVKRITFASPRDWCSCVRSPLDQSICKVVLDEMVIGTRKRCLTMLQS